MMHRLRAFELAFTTNDLAFGAVKTLHFYGH